MRAVSRRIAPQSTVPQRGAEVAAGEDVLGDGQVLEDRRLLVHRDDAEPMRGLRVADPPRLARRSTSSPSSGWTMPVRILTSVDLPAPFSPTSAWTVPGADREAHVGDCLDAAVAARDAAQLEQRSGAGGVRSTRLSASTATD